MARVRDTDLAPRMSEHEALMWSIEKDPWLNPSGAAVVLLDRPLDGERFRRTLRAALAKTPRLYQRVVPGFARVSTPAWVPDHEFDLDAHFREVVLPAPGSQRQLFDLAAQIYSEPLDRTRPLWRMVSISGLEGGGGALWTIIHHSVSDGIGQMRMAELYQQTTRDAADPADVDLEAIIAAAVAESTAKESGGNLASSPVSTIRDSMSHLVRRQIGISRRVAGELAMWPADPSRATGRVSTVVDTVRSTASLLGGRGDEGVPRTATPLWERRSRHRHLEWVRVDVADLKAVGAAGGATINDVFLAALAEAAHRYHAARGVDIDTVNSSFVLSTRKDNKAGGNAFTPVPVQLPAGPMMPAERLAAVVDVVEAAKNDAQRTGGMTGLSGIINLLPTSVVTQTARSQAGKIDFATSNLRGAPFPLFVSGAKVTATICLGPVAGTGANITAMSYDGAFDIGIFADPEAITEPTAFRDDVHAAFADLVADVRSSGSSEPTAPTTSRAGATTKRAAKKPATNKPAAKKRAAKKPAAKKPAAKKPAAKKRAAKKRAANKSAAKKSAGR